MGAGTFTSATGKPGICCVSRMASCSDEVRRELNRDFMT
jgi:hypothetical protein